MKEYITFLLNGLTIVEFLVFMTYAYGGLVLNLIFDVLQRKPLSPESPIFFSFKYFFKDNWKRLIMSVMLIPIVILLFKQLMGSEINYLSAFLLGWASDGVSNLIKRRSSIFNTEVK